MNIYTNLFILTLSFSTILSYFLYSLGIPFFQQILGVKDLILAIGFFFYLLKFLKKLINRDIDSIDAISLIILALNISSFIISPAPLGDKLFNFRRNTSFIFILLIFKEFGCGYKSPEDLKRIINPIFFIIFFFGIIEYFLPNSFWEDEVGILKYWTALEIDPFVTPSISESGRFFSWDLQNILGDAVRRVVSIYFEPTTLAAFFTFCFILASISKNFFLRGMVLLIGSLTISKFFAISIISIYLIFKYKEKLPNSLLKNVFLFSFVASALILLFEFESGAFQHLKGVTSVVEIFQEKKFFGLGIGAAGNYSDAESETADIGAESGFGNVVAQLGLGIIFYLALLNSIYIKLLNQYKNSKKIIFICGICCLISWSISFMLSASSMGLSGNAFFFIFIGSLLFISKNSQNGK